MNLSVMMGCMNETEIGTTPMVHMLPLLDYADMDGPLLLDVPEPAFYRYDYGKMILNKQA
jgi:L-alanine-DL-glutamate epimerase-like enolase superfamily enzyme